MEIKDKVVVVTGSSQGLGKSLATALSKLGAKVLVSARKQEEIESVAQEIGALAVPADVTDEKQVEALAQAAKQQFGRINIWINNAGVFIPNPPLADFNSKKMHDQFEINLFGVIYGMIAAFNVMKEQNSGVIVNIISTAALLPNPGVSGYAASKFAAKGFAQALRPELEQNNIKVINVYPFKISKEAADKYFSDNIAAKIVENLVQEQPEEELVFKK